MSNKEDYVEIKYGVISACSKMNIQYRKALDALVEEVYKRTAILLEFIENDNGDKDTNVDSDNNKSPVIVTALKADLDVVAKQYGKLQFDDKSLTHEGYYIYISSVGRIVIYIIGADYRGILYGIGKLLRNISWGKNSLRIKSEMSIISNPVFAVRGHQIGYRPKTNAYDAWDEKQYEQYIRELAFFGANAIELIPPRSDDALLSSHMKLDPFEMMIITAGIIESYGLDVWIWYPNVGKDYISEEGLKFELAEREEIFSKLPKITALSIPGGDPGELDADHFFEWSYKIAEILNKYHPEAKIWISPQNFLLTKEWVEYFYKRVNQKPEWLGGVVFGPWERDPAEILREKISKDIPIRNYPDITHSYFAQYAIPDWDIAFAMTLGRECINPRPAAMKHIHHSTAGFTIGGITYSEGINDDVNKFVWAELDWNPEASVYDVVREYASLFISSELADNITQAIMLLEENWDGSVLSNSNIRRTYFIWSDIEKRLKDDVKDNYRFKLCLLRAIYDAYIRRNLIYETEMEQQVLDILEKCSYNDINAGVSIAVELLDKMKNNSIGVDLRARCLKLADELFDLIGAQFSVIRHEAIRWQRGAFMDDIDLPLSDYEWIREQLTQGFEEQDDKGKRVIVQNILDIKLGIGKGYYDNMGTSFGKRRITNKLEWEKDPGFRTSPLAAFATPFLHREVEDIKTGPVPLSWISNITAYTGIPVKLKYENLCSYSSYCLKIMYAGYQYGQRRSMLKLIANDYYVIHDNIDIKGKCMLKEYTIPAEVVKNGTIELAWISPDGYQGPSIAEVWLEKRDE